MCAPLRHPELSPELFGHAPYLFIVSVPCQLFCHVGATRDARGASV